MSLASSVVANEGPIRLGKDLYGAMIGGYDDLQIFDVALSAAEVTMLAGAHTDLDSDGDGLTDYEEARRGTNPNLPDSDWDGTSDRVEILEGTDPNDWQSVVEKRIAYYPFDALDLRSAEGQRPREVPQGFTAAEQVAGAKGRGVKTSNNQQVITYDWARSDGSPNYSFRRGTMRLWIKPDWSTPTMSGTWSRLYQIGAPWGGADAWTQIRMWASGQASMNYNANDGFGHIFDFETTVPFTWASGTWHQVVLTYSPTGRKIYVDGVEIGSNTTYWPHVPDLQDIINGGLTIGNEVTGYQPIKGTIDEVEFFNHELDATRILADYTQMAPLVPELETNDPEWTPENTVPFVDAGPNRAVAKESVKMTAGVSDPDAPPQVLTYRWRKVSGPGGVTFSDPTALNPTATLSQPGVYELELSVSDGAARRSDRVIIQRNATTNNIAVSFTNPGKNAQFEFPSTVTLRATATGAMTVEYYAGNQLIGQSSTPPYTVHWTPPRARRYRLTARAVNAAGAAAFSAPRNIQVGFFPGIVSPEGKGGGDDNGTGFNPNDPNYDPKVNDDDGDGLSDAEENRIGTDLGSDDSDSDGVFDGEDGWANDPDLSPPRLPEVSYAVIKLSELGITGYPEQLADNGDIRWTEQDSLGNDIGPRLWSNGASGPTSKLILSPDGTKFVAEEGGGAFNIPSYEDDGALAVKGSAPSFTAMNNAGSVCASVYASSNSGASPIVYRETSGAALWPGGDEPVQILGWNVSQTNSGTSPTGPKRFHPQDINESDDLVGWWTATNGSPAGSGAGYIAQAEGPESQMDELPSDSTFPTAFSINNQDPPWIGGDDDAAVMWIEIGGGWVKKHLPGDLAGSPSAVEALRNFVNDSCQFAGRSDGGASWIVRNGVYHDLTTLASEPVLGTVQDQTSFGVILTTEEILLPFDLGIDSDNNNGFDLPSRTQVEREERGVLGDIKKPGKLIFVNDGDIDADGVPDFADGLDVFENDGDGEQDPECPDFVPLILETGKLGSYDSLTLRFTYSASDPASMQKASDGQGGYIYTPAAGRLRIWAKNGTEYRKVDSVSEGGDFVASGMAYSASDLGFDEENEKVTLYVEALGVSEEVADLEIKVEAKWTGGAFQHSDSVRLTAMNLALMEVDENETVSPAREIKLSLPAPKVTVGQISVTGVQPGVNGDGIVGSISVAGGVTCRISDITPGSNGTISEAYVHVNGSDDPVATIPLGVSKSSDEDSFYTPFPYAGSFNQTISNVELKEGPNIVRIVAKDPINGNEGYAEYSFEVEGISPLAQNGGESVSLSIGFAGSLSDTIVDTLTASLVTQGTTGVYNISLVETAADSRIFVSPDATFTVAITDGADDFDDAETEELYAVVTHTTLGIEGLNFAWMQEVEPHTRTFHKALSWSDEDYELEDYTGYIFTTSQASFGAASEGHVFNPYLLQVQGPDLFLDNVEHIDTEDGPRKIEKSSIDDNYYVKMKNSPAVVVLFTPPAQKDGEPDHEAILAAMKDSADFAMGFGHGFGAAGWDMVEGVWGLFKFTVKSGVRYSSVGVVWVMKHGDRFQSEKDMIRVGKQTAATIAPIVLEIAQDAVEIRIALATGRFVDAAEISAPYAIAMEYTAELLVEVMKDLAAAPPREQGYYMGYATFEITTLAAAWAKAGKLSKVGQFGKANFLDELRALPFFSSGGGAAAFARLEQFLLRLTTATACFPAGTQIRTLHGAKPIEAVAPGDMVWSRCEETGVADFRRVRQVFRRNAPRLVQIVYRPEGLRHLPRSAVDSGEDDSPAADPRRITATPEHPFYVCGSSTFVPVGELEVGDRFVNADGQTFEVAGLEEIRAGEGEAFPVYNFEVEEFHTYFAGTDALWVHNACGGRFDSLYSLYLRFLQKDGKTPEEAFELLQSVRATATRDGVRLTHAQMGQVLDEAIRKDVYPSGGPIWTVAQNYGPLPGNNMWKHFLDHGDEVGVNDAVSYVKKARNFTANFGTGPEWKRWIRVEDGDIDEIFMNKITREFSVVARNGPDAGGTRTYFPVKQGRDLLDYAIENDYNEAINGPW